MKKILLILIMSIGMATVPNTAISSHAVGGDITLKQIGALRYVVLLRFYRDCAGIQAGNNAIINYMSSSQGIQGTIILPAIDSLASGQPNGSEVLMNHCIQSSGSSTCNGGGNWGVNEWRYSDTLDLPAYAIDWIFWYSNAPRNVTIDNIIGTYFTVKTTIDNLSLIDTSPLKGSQKNGSTYNSSPICNSIPTVRVCLGKPFQMDQLAYDPDGDSLVFSLSACLDGGPFSPVTYPIPYTPLNPFGAPIPPGIKLNPLSGLLEFVPHKQMEAVVGILVEEFRNGKLIGSVLRDMQFRIGGSCHNDLPNVITDTVSPTGTQSVSAQCGDTMLTFHLANSVRCNSVAVDGSDFRALNKFGQPIPIFRAEAVNCHSSLTDKVNVYFHNNLYSGTTKVWIKKGTDNNTLISKCGSSIPEFDTVSIYTSDTADLNVSLQHVSMPQNSNWFTLNMNSEFLCSTIASDGSDFVIQDANGKSHHVLSTVSVYCSGNTNTTDQIGIIMDPTTTNAAKPLYLVVAKGSDGNSVSNVCYNFLEEGDTLAEILSRTVPNVMTTQHQRSSDLNTLFNENSLDKGSTILSYSIFDVSGRIVQQSSTDILSSYNSLPPGTYILLLKLDDSSIVRKRILVRK